MAAPRNVQVDDGPDSFELQATGPTFLNVAMKETILHEAEPWSWHGAVVDIYIYISFYMIYRTW